LGQIPIARLTEDSEAPTAPSGILTLVANILRRSGLTLAVVVLTMPALLAQTRRPTAELMTSADSKVTARGGSARLTLRVALPSGLHVQANKPRDPDLIPTVLTVEAPKGAKIAQVIYPKPVDFAQAGAAQPLAVYPNVFDIVVQVSFAPGVAPGTLNIPATLRYQACNESLCFPPSKAEARWSLTVPKG
jgi:DsbC/DsbD-like thiol-disulfide interchange protein